MLSLISYKVGIGLGGNWKGSTGRNDAEHFPYQNFPILLFGHFYSLWNLKPYPWGQNSGRGEVSRGEIWWGLFSHLFCTQCNPCCSPLSRKPAWPTFWDVDGAPGFLLIMNLMSAKRWLCQKDIDSFLQRFKTVWENGTAKCRYCGNVHSSKQWLRRMFITSTVVLI